MRNQWQAVVRRAGLLLLACGLLAGFAGAQEAPVYQGEPVKYVFLFIGDGMGSAQRSSSDHYNGAVSGKKVNDIPVAKMLMNSFPVQGLTTTYSSNSIITDSAAAGTAMATGHKTRDGVIGMDAAGTTSLTSIAELAKKAGRQVGIVTSVSLDHATPASFYAHTPGRGSYYDIAEQMVKKDFDYFGGGQLKGFHPEKNKDKPDLYELARKNGFTITFGKDGLATLKPGTRAIAFTGDPDGDAALQYNIDRKESDATLADFTRKGIELLSGKPAGFFLMVEGGKIDWACHANDARTAITENLALDEAVTAAFEFMKQHPKETLIVVTGDHETGGLTIGFSGTGYKSFPDKLQGQKMSFLAFSGQVKKWRADKMPFEERLPEIKAAFGFQSLSKDEETRLKTAYERSMQEEKERSKDSASGQAYGSYDPLTVTCTHILNNQAGLGWTTYSHTGVPVVTSATGAGSELFGGYYDNTDIFYKLKAAMGIKD